jgi:hypothetical protein
MSDEVVDVQCFLCGAKAQASRFSVLGYYVNCSSDACGDYRLSDTARRRLEKHPVLGPKLSQGAAKARQANMVLCITARSAGDPRLVKADFIPSPARAQHQ